MEIKVLKNILSANNQIAEQNRRLLAGKSILAVNVMSSPGAGKTTLMLRTAEELKGKARIAVIEGDVSSSIDTERLSQAGVTAIQINTGGGCHLDAGMVNSALLNLPLDELDIVFIENVGNLICPGEFELGEHLKVVISSTPEGEDKPYKYPLLFTIADAVVVNKTDIIPYVDFDMDGFSRAVKGLNQKAALFKVCGITGEGIGDWGAWIMKKLNEIRANASNK
ncbi:hydrogenase nickel incorporation protein HypB [Chloroflexota bacterium]